MASRVNVRFVTILAAALALVGAGVAAVGFFVLRNSGEELMAIGDKHAQAGEFDRAISFYSRAVNKSPQNVDWIQKWLDALEETTPSSRQVYTDRYRSQYLLALHGRADAEPTNVGYRRRMLDETMTRLRRYGGAELGAWEEMIAQADAALAHFPEPRSAEAETLRRYRGISRQQVQALGVPVSDEDIERAEADLIAAAAADPSDVESVTSLAELFRARADQAQLRNRTEEAKELSDRARGVVQAYLDEHPESAEARIELLVLDFLALNRGNIRPTPWRDYLVSNADRVADLRDTILATDPADVTDRAVLPAIDLVSAALPGGTLEAEALMDHALGARPKDAVLLLSRATIAQRDGRFEEAVKRFGEVAALPDLPLSLDGLVLLDLRARAVRLQAETLLSQADATTDSAAKEDLLRRVEGFREDYVTRAGDTDTALLLIDGRLAFHRGQLTKARTLLGEYNTRTNDSDAAALMLLGEVLRQQQNYGGAIDQFQLAAKIRPEAPSLWLGMASAATNLQRFDDALVYLRRAQELAPEDEGIAVRIANIENVSRGAESGDPVVRALAQWQEQMGQLTRDYDAASEVLMRGIEETRDVRLYHALAVTREMAGDREGAEKAVQDGLAVMPDHPGLKQIERAFGFERPIDSVIEAINSRDVDEVTKNILRYQAYSAAGMPEEANREFDAAVAAAPEDQRVVALRFERAVREENAEEAGRLAQLAAERNLDNANGLLYRAAVEDMSGRAGAAVESVQGAIAIDELNIAAWQRLGELQMGLGRYVDAEASFRRACDIKPDSVAAVVGLVRALGAQERFDDALDFARRNRDYGRLNQTFVNLWLELESQAPSGDHEMAIRTRQQIAAGNPDNIDNRVRLALLLVGEKRWDEAWTVIDALRTSDTKSQGFMELAARWHSAQGDMDSAAKVVEDYVNGLAQEELTDAPFIFLARLRFGAGDLVGALQVLSQAEPYQNKELLSTAREEADMLFAAMNFEEALRIYGDIRGRVPSDPDLLIGKRMIECMTRLGRFEEAETFAKSLGESADRDPILLLLRAEAAAGRGERDSARRMLDQAVASDPKNPGGYVRRANFLIEHFPDLRGDAEADLAEALKLDPRHKIARQRLAEMFANAGRWDDAIAQLKQALDYDQRNDTLRMRIVSILLERNRGGEALDLIDKAIEASPRSSGWLARKSATLGALGRRADAIEPMRRAWEMEKSPGAASLYASVMLESPNPDLARAVEVLSSPEAQADKNIAVLMTRARAYTRLQQAQRARADVAAALALVDPADNQSVTEFMAGLGLLASDPGERVRILASLRPAEGFTGWMQFAYASLALTLPEAEAEAFSALRGLAQSGASDQIKLTAAKRLGGHLYSQGKVEDAVTWFRAGLEAAPNDPELNNNVAYALAFDLGRAAEAEPYAERAAKLLPRSPMILDTLGVVHTRLGNRAKADDVLQRALAAATSPQTRAPVLMHLAELRADQSDPIEAERYLRSLEEVIRSEPNIGAAYNEQIVALRKRLEG